MTSSDFCSVLNLSGTNETICKTFENTPLTLNLIYRFFGIIESRIPLLTNGLEDIVKKNATKIFIQDIILQQAPWFISFLLMIIVLWSLKIISAGVFFFLLIISILITAILITVYSYRYKYNVEKLINEIKTQTKTNINNFKNFG